MTLFPYAYRRQEALFVKLPTLDVKLEGDKYAEFEGSYQFEEENGRSPFITGNISCHAGCAKEILVVAFTGVS